MVGEEEVGEEEEEEEEAGGVGGVLGRRRSCSRGGRVCRDSREVEVVGL